MLDNFREKDENFDGFSKFFFAFLYITFAYLILEMLTRQASPSHCSLTIRCKFWIFKNIIRRNKKITRSHEEQFFKELLHILPGIFRRSSRVLPLPQPLLNILPAVGIVFDRWSIFPLFVLTFGDRTCFFFNCKEIYKLKISIFSIIQSTK